MLFTIEVDEEWFPALESLAALVAAQGDSSPEEALEKAIFVQIEEQHSQSA